MSRRHLSPASARRWRRRRRRRRRSGPRWSRGPRRRAARKRPCWPPVMESYSNYRQPGRRPSMRLGPPNGIVRVPDSWLLLCLDLPVDITAPFSGSDWCAASPLDQVLDRLPVRFDWFAWLAERRGATSAARIIHPPAPRPVRHGVGPRPPLYSRWHPDSSSGKVQRCQSRFGWISGPISSVKSIDRPRCGHPQSTHDVIIR